MSKVIKKGQKGYKQFFKDNTHKKKIEGVTEYFKIIKHVKSENLKRKNSANSAKKNSYLTKTTTKEQ